MSRQGPRSVYNDPFTPEGRELINVAKVLVINARTETERAEATLELQKVLEYVKAHLRVNKNLHPCTGAQLLLSPMESRKPLQ